jgi:hypothetical protein
LRLEFRHCGGFTMGRRAAAHNSFSAHFRRHRFTEINQTLHFTILPYLVVKFIRSLTLAYF